MLDALINLGPFQWSGLIFGIVYVLLAAKSRASCFYFAILSSLAIAIEDFTKTKLYSDGWLQIFYIFMAIWGLWQWRQGRAENNVRVLPIRRMTGNEHGKAILLSILLSLPIGLLFRYYSNANFPVLDALTSGFAVVATFLLICRKLENWIYFVVIDIVYVYQYWDTEAPLFSILFALYAILAIYGYQEWRKELKTQGV